jgi:hypothetical protein
MKAYLLEQTLGHWTYREVDGEPMGRGAGPLVFELQEIPALNWTNTELAAEMICEMRNRRTP